MNMIEHPQYDEAHQLLQQLAETAGMKVSGDATAGESTILKHFDAMRVKEVKEESDSCIGMQCLLRVWDELVKRVPVMTNFRYKEFEELLQREGVNVVDDIPNHSFRSSFGRPSSGKSE